LQAIQLETVEQKHLLKASFIPTTNCQALFFPASTIVSHQIQCSYFLNLSDSTENNIGHQGGMHFANSFAQLSRERLASMKLPGLDDDARIAFQSNQLSFASHLISLISRI